MSGRGALPDGPERGRRSAGTAAAPGEAEVHARDWSVLHRFARALADAGAETVPVGPPVVPSGEIARATAADLDALTSVWGRAISSFWQEEVLTGAPPSPLAVGPAPVRLLAVVHDLASLALRPDAEAMRALEAEAGALPVSQTVGDALAAHAMMRRARRWAADWPEPLRVLFGRLNDRSPLTRFAHGDLALARDWTGTEVVFEVPALQPWARLRLIPPAGAPERFRAAGAILAVLAEGRGTPARRAFVLDVYETFLYHERESIPLSDGDGGRRERGFWQVFADLERRLRSHDREENRKGAAQFAYFDPLLEIAAAEPAALERYPNITREVLLTLAGLARWVARGAESGRAFVPAGPAEDG